MTQLEQIQVSSAPFYPYGESLVCLEHDCGATFPLSLSACPACGSRASYNAAKVHGGVLAVVVGLPRLKPKAVKRWGRVGGWQ